MLINDIRLANTAALVSLFETITVSPYVSYPGFARAVTRLIEDHREALSGLDPVREIFGERQGGRRKVALIRGCPIDRHIPVFDQNDPVNDKHRVKTSFVGETLLEVVSQLGGMPILSYTTRNGGDFFQDVYAQNQFSGTQTQKTDSDLYFHNDRTAHKIRADVLCLLGMRSDPANIINTQYIHGEDLLALVETELHDVLRQDHFTTPFDEISKASNATQVDSGRHAILIETSAFRYYETRTTVADGAPAIAWRALAAVKTAITKAPRLRVPIQEGELFIFPNLEGLHSRDRVHVPHPESARRRYLLKTYNFWDISRCDRFGAFFVNGMPGLVDDAKLEGQGLAVAS